MLHIKSGIFCKFRAVLGIILVFGIYSPLTTALTSPEFELLKSFGKQEGNPTGRLVQDANGDIYGTTRFGGNKGGLGTIFKISASGTYSNLHSFDGFEGMTPTALIQGVNGKLYGITDDGGIGFDGHSLSGGYGTVFQLDISGPTPVYCVLHKFDGTNGALPTGLIQGSNGNLYGTTSGDYENTGTVFQLDISTATPVYSVLHTFTLALGPLNIGGARDLTLGSDGKLYGLALVSRDRTISYYFFSLDISGTTPAYTVLYEFVDAPDSLIQGRDGKLYGASSGKLFQLDISGAAPIYTVLYNGGGIGRFLTQGSDRKFYGTTSLEGRDNVDTVFQLDIFGKTPTYTVLHEFDGVNSGDPSVYLIQGRDNKLYGAAASGNGTPFGRHFNDIIFQLDITGKSPIYNILHKFDSNSTEIRPAGVIQGSDGNFYGTTEYGGNYDAGTVFKLDISQDLPVYNVLHAFNLFPDLANVGGGLPGAAPLVQGRDGKLYGSTIYGGSADKGTVFQVDISSATPTYRVLHEFDEDSIAYNSNTTLIQGLDGKFYGGTAGTIFNIDTSGTTPIYTVLHEFSPPYNGMFINFLQGSDGKFYGATPIGGSSGLGTVFQFDTSGAAPVYAVLYEFDGTNGSYPRGALIQGSNGKLYGTTYFGGSFDRGTVFQLDISGTTPIYTVLHEFDGISGGPASGLTQGSDGKLYGATSKGSHYAGTVFQLDISGAKPIYTVLHEFTGTSNDGQQPSGKIIQASDGNLYGTTAYGGNFGDGVIYRLRMPPTNTPPVAVNDSFALHAPKRKAPVTVAAPGVLGNDKDIEGNPLTVVGAMDTTPKIIEFPHEGGKVALYADGHFVYTPAKGCFYGTGSFTYQSTDGQTASNTATVTLTTIPPRHEGHRHHNKHRKNEHSGHQHR